MTATIVGYARTSTIDQKAGFDAQLRDLAAHGCTKTFAEQVSSVAERAELERCLDYVREGDTLVVTKLDRLARSMHDLMSIIDRLDKKGVSLRILAMNLDTGTPTGKLMLSVLGAVAQFEREMMLERQREGVAKAKAEGKYTGRQPTAQRQSGDVLKLKASGKTMAEIMTALNISESSYWRILRAAKKEQEEA
ncbi:recombinase family protein [Rhizobium sp. NLR12b]|uniref:recombinase family protein n=1 Tax=Rhizobium sp. NLR12b TaxID=2731108 RepID=UPI001C832E5B|nr:recombinase family protein [Rhizobium sp. NLR12b]MBX5302442.1 recombinase family protein [Rhizobium sp. NLR12b]